MSSFRLPDDTNVGHVHLQVSDLQRAIDFYVGLLGFREVKHDGSTAFLSATGEVPYHILLTGRPGARRKPARTTGLYHFAIRLPDRRKLARTLRRLKEQNYPITGASDHKVSEALYLDDPDGNGLELYRDRPRDRWPWRDGSVVMTTDPLDLADLMREVSGDVGPWAGIHPQTDIGHVHLHVSNLARAEGFYHNLLGLDVMQRDYPGALFVSAGDYHHHVGLNIWAGEGAPPAPPDAVGLLSFALQVPDDDTLHALLDRVRDAGTSPQHRMGYEHAASVLIPDQDGNGVELLAERAAFDSDFLAELGTDASGEGRSERRSNV